MSPLETILNPADAVIDAWLAILKKAKQNAYRTFSDETKKTPYMEVQISGLKAAGQQYAFQGEALWSSWSATLTTRVKTNRGQNSARHAPMCARVLVESAKFRSRFSPAIMPAHSIAQMRLTGLNPSTDGFLDQTEINHDVLIVVRDDAWPDSQN
jgi:hypothetical protein